MINYGLIDRSRKICDEYAAIDSRIIVIHKGNGGVSSARNIGLDNVHLGKYVIFVDGDDYVSNKLYGACIKAEVTKDSCLIYISFVYFEHMSML